MRQILRNIITEKMFINIFYNLIKTMKSGIFKKSSIHNVINEQVIKTIKKLQGIKITNSTTSCDSLNQNVLERTSFMKIYKKTDC